MRFIVYTLLLGSILLNGCKKEEYIIPRKTFQQMLLDLHMADAIYLNNWGKYSIHTDSLNFYNTIFEQYGFNRACFDSTLKYYILKPKELDEIYDNVLNNLQILEGEITQVNNFYIDSANNLFTRKKRWSLPLESKNSKIPFDIEISDSALYIINVYAKKFGNDQSKNLRITAYFWYPDSTTKEWQRLDFPEIKYHTGSYFNLFSTSKLYPFKRKGRLRGWILNHDQQEIDFKKHIDIKMIYIEKKMGPSIPLRIK